MIVLIIIALITALVAVIATIISQGHKILWIMISVGCGVITLMLCSILKMGVFNIVIWSIFSILGIFILICNLRKPRT
jgi:hypothetical protein